MIYEVITAVTLYRAIPGLEVNLLALIDEVIVERARQLPIEGPLLPYLYI